MGKKVKKKARSGQKEKRPAPSPKTVSQQVKIRAETNEDVVVVVKDKTLCSHIDKGINLEKLSAKLGSSESRNCEDCRENLIDRGAKKGKDKHGKKGGKSESKAIWICLECGHFSCGSVGLPTTPNTHAIRHAKQNHHRLVVHYENHQLVWCFSCNKLISAEKTDDNKHKEVLNEVVKMLKAQPDKGLTVDVEDVWFGSGSVTSAVNSDYSIKASADGRAGYSVRGLVNLGNTCFFNSIMQNLLSISSLRDYFIKLDDSVGPLNASMRKLFQETSSRVDSRGAINPRSLFGSLCTMSPQFRGYQQHDSHELLRCLLDGLSSEESNVRKHTKSSVTDPTFVDVIFGGQLSSTVNCLECGHSSTIHEPFLDLSLPVPTKKPPSRRNQPVTRGKKPKLPPKRNGRNHLSKMSRNANPRLSESVSEQPTGGNTSCEVQSITQPENQLVVFSGDSALSDSINPNLDMGLMDEDLIEKPPNQQAVAQTEERLVLFSGEYDFSDSFDPNTVALDMGFTDDDLSAIQKPQNQQAVENSDSYGWLDFLDPDPVAHNIEVTSETDQISVNQGFPNECILPEDVSLSIALHASIENDLANAVSATYLDNIKDSNAVDQGVLAQEQNAFSQVEDKQDVNLLVDENPSYEGSFSKAVVQFNAGTDHGSDSCSQTCSKDSNTSGRENDNPSQIQDSKVMLPLNKEDEASSVEVPKAETEMLGDEKESLDFEGFGDLFNEPEVSLASNVTKNGVTVHSSESDPDEVDNADAPVSVESCLAFFTKPELLTKDEHAWQCDNCSKILREQRKKSRRISPMRISEIAPNGCENRNPSGLQTSNIVKDINKNLEKDATDISDISSLPQKQEIYENGKCQPGTWPEIETNVIEFQSECPSDQNLDHRSLEECDSDKNGLPETDLVNAECESDASTHEDVNSENLKVKRDAKKSILISKAPSILTIHLKRFSQDARGRLSKLNGHVNFRETIDLNPYMDPRCTNEGRFTYRLVGVVEHLGTMRGGHYVAYVRATKENGDSIWYHASDAYVREASLQEVLRCEAYILFYEGT